MLHWETVPQQLEMPEIPDTAKEAAMAKWLDGRTMTVAELQMIANLQGILECFRHVCVARSRLGEDGKMDVEKHKVCHHGNTQEVEPS